MIKVRLTTGGLRQKCLIKMQRGVSARYKQRRKKKKKVSDEGQIRKVPL